MRRKRTSIGMALLWGVLLLGSASAGDEPPVAPPADLVDLAVTYPADLRDAVLRIAENEGVVAVDPASGKEMNPTPLPPVAQPMSVLHTGGAALARLRGESLDLDLFLALGDIAVLYKSGVGLQCRLTLRPRGEQTEADRQATVDRLAAVFKADEELVAATEQLRVSLGGTRGRAPEHERLIRVGFDLTAGGSPPAKPDPTRTTPTSISGRRIIELMRTAGKLSGRVEREVRTVFDAAARHRTVIRTADVMCDSRDPWHLWSFLKQVEAKECVTVVEVRYERDGYHLARPAAPEDHGFAEVKFAVRLPWISSDELRSGMDRTAAGRATGAAPSEQRLHLRCPQDRVGTMLRLLSADGITVRRAEDGKLLRPSSPKTIDLAPSAAALLRALTETFAKTKFEVTGIDAYPSWLKLTLLCELPRSGLDLTDAEALQAAVEKRLHEAWKAVSPHPFLKQRIESAQIETATVLGKDDPKSMRISVPVYMDLRDEPARRAAAGEPLVGDSLAPLRKLALDSGWPVPFVAPWEGSPRFSEGIMRFEGLTTLRPRGLDELDAEDACDALEAVERLPGASVEAFSWTKKRGIHSLELTMQYPLWGEPR